MLLVLVLLVLLVRVRVRVRVLVLVLVLLLLLLLLLLHIGNLEPLIRLFILAILAAGKDDRHLGNLAGGILWVWVGGGGGLHFGNVGKLGPLGFRGANGARIDLGCRGLGGSGLRVFGFKGLRFYGIVLRTLGACIGLDLY